MQCQLWRKSAFVGAGPIGGGLARLAVQAEHEVIVSNPRDPFSPVGGQQRRGERDLRRRRHLHPLQALDRHGDVTVHARTDGTYDKTGLPDPLILSLYFSLRDERITQLIIIHNKARA